MNDIFAASLFCNYVCYPTMVNTIYHCIFTILGIACILGIKYYFEVLAIKIKNEIYRKIVSGIIIIVIAIIYQQNT